MATTVSLTEFAGLTLKQKLARAERINRLKAQGLILPLLVFLFVVFLLPIGILLYKSVENPEVVGSLPRTVEAIASWDGRGLPEEPVYQALAQDLAADREDDHERPVLRNDRLTEQHREGQQHRGAHRSGAWPGESCVVHERLSLNDVVCGGSPRGCRQSPR